MSPPELEGAQGGAVRAGRALSQFSHLFCSHSVTLLTVEFTRRETKLGLLPWKLEFGWEAHPGGQQEEGLGFLSPIRLRGLALEHHSVIIVDKVN